MYALLIAVSFASLSFFSAPAGAGEGAISSLDRSGGTAVSVPVPVNPEAAASAEAQVSMKLWNEYIEKNFGGRPAAVSRLSSKAAAGAIAETVDLARIHNANLKSGLTFRSSANTIYVSGTEALNCPGDVPSCSINDRYFLTFTTEGGQTLFVLAKSVANALFMSGQKEISFPGDTEKYTIKLEIKLTNPSQSMIRIIGPGEEVLNASLTELTAALANRGYILSVGARHRLYYSTGVLQDAKSNGRFARENVLIFSPQGPEPNQTIKASQITPSGVLLPDVEKDFGFRIVREKLEIYRL